MVYYVITYYHQALVVLYSEQSNIGFTDLSLLNMILALL